jgi:peroxiredoxin
MLGFSALHRSKRLVVVCGLFIAVFAQAAFADDSQSANQPLPIDRGMMQRLSNFTLKDVTNGRSLMLYGFQGRKAIVLVFLGNECPVGNLYVPRLIEINREFSKKGVVILGINSNAHETEADVAKFVKERGIDFPVLKDPQNLVADSALVEKTCEIIVLDGFARIVYRGAIDDQHIQGKSKDAPDHNYLRDALGALVSGGKIATRATTVAGCVLDRVPPKPLDASRAPKLRGAAPQVVAALAAKEKEHPIEIGKVSFAGEVAAILENKCQNCHRPGQVAPFSLLTYDDARKHSATIREVVTERRMPPWHADPQYGHFVNDRSLSATERATLLAWLDQGTPLGDPKAIPAPRKFPEGWSIGEPDAVFEIPEPYYVPAQGVVSYVYFQVPTNFKEDRWVQAAEAVPGDRSVVHHIIVYVIDPKGEGDMRARLSHFCGYAPGDAPSVFPEGTAKRVPAGAMLMFQVHYTPTGKVKTDRSKVGFVFSKTKPTREAFTLGIANADLLLPAGSGNIEVASSKVLPIDVRVLSFMPHMHLRGKDFKYTFTKPGESPQTVLSVPAFDFAWQTYYVLKDPIELPKGSVIDCLAHFDNSDSNPYNPDSTKLVRWGEQTFEEMMIGYLDMDVPVGSPIIRDNDFRPRTERATMNALQKMRRAFGGNQAAGGSPIKKAPEKGARP